MEFNLKLAIFFQSLGWIFLASEMTSGNNFKIFGVSLTSMFFISGIIILLIPDSKLKELFFPNPMSDSLG